MDDRFFALVCLILLVSHEQTRVVASQPVEKNVLSRSLDGEGPVVDASTLRLVQAVFRHGDRSQIRAYKNDIYTEADWPQGYGQLSTTGMLQEYKLGQYLKQKYVDSGFMNAHYTREQITVRSTNYDRTLMSAYSLLAGLFPPAGNQVWNPTLPWQPIPVHTVSMDEDYLLHTDVDCPKYSDYVAKYSADNEVIKKTVHDNHDLYQYMSEHAGEDPTWNGMAAVLDPIFCQYVSGKKLPDWVTVGNTLERLINLTDIYSTVGIPPPVAYLIGGLLVGEMIDHMQNKSLTPDSQQKMYLYSAHDSTINAHLKTLGIFNGRKPQYTACVITELHEPSKGEYYVRILYKNETGPDRPPYVLKLNNCDSLCPLNHFHDIMKSSVPSDIKKECGLPDSSPSPMTSKEATVAVVVLTSLVILMLLVGGVLCCLLKRNIRNTHNYSPVPIEMN